MKKEGKKLSIQSKDYYLKFQDLRLSYLSDETHNSSLYIEFHNRKQNPG